MAGGIQQQAPLRLRRPAAGGRDWNKRSRSWTRNDCASSEAMHCARRWPAGCNRRILNRPIKQEEAVLAWAKAQQAAVETTPAEDAVVVGDQTGTVKPVECDRADFCAAMDAPASREVFAENSKERRTVSFMDTVTIYSIPPYAEIYGLHPREFVFDRKYSMIPAGCTLTCAGLSAVDKEGAEDYVEESDDDFDDDGPWEVEELFSLAQPLD
eukprot:TRINITY_DN125801_c0_g1_i1.p1 TRINITY_DN125801_c0_g1~~TRINITY_DN125801_c0_g1_i1.p1  ORF type:complete len:242 (+),score=37.05 TRINITY_DN125801_c0_g1_i1:93-728(+)